MIRFSKLMPEKLRITYSIFGVLSMTVLILVSHYSCSTNKIPKADSDGWFSLFNGKNLKGWTAGGDMNTFKVEDGMIRGHGSLSHLYYTGPLLNHDFKDFEFEAKLLTKPGTNSGVYFHTTFQERRFPWDGFEVQVSNGSKNWGTGSLFGLKNFGQEIAKDNEWFTMYIKVVGKTVNVKINGEEEISWTQPEDHEVDKEHPGRFIESGTFAFQVHDPKTDVYLKDIRVRPL